MNILMDDYLRLSVSLTIVMAGLRALCGGGKIIMGNKTKKETQERIPESP